ncbi:MAG: DMT family transporter [Ancalomicrobiaceae bacterium]|nr:DMT family transporter [Ancalomicrobiaceae bacterium]
MASAILLALIGGLCVSLSRQLNGRLSLSTTPMVSSFWNHLVGFLALCTIGAIVGGLIPPSAFSAPPYAYLGGAMGVIFVAAGNWLIVRIGAVATAVFTIAGQMISGVATDFVHTAGRIGWPSLLGATLILAGVALSQLRPRT